MILEFWESSYLMIQEIPVWYSWYYSMLLANFDNYYCACDDTCDDKWNDVNMFRRAQPLDWEVNNQFRSTRSIHLGIVLNAGYLDLIIYKDVLRHWDMY